MQLKKIHLFIISLILFQIMGCGIDDKYKWRNRAVKHYDEFITYNLLRPAQKVTLEEDLIEISGLTHLGANKIACIEDESGNIYTISDEDGKILNKTKFYKHGDYEGIANVGEDLYVIKSNGNIYKWSDGKLDKRETELTARNNVEGMCYDPISDHMLIVCKEEGGIENEIKDAKVVYAYDYKSDSLIKIPKFIIPFKTVHEYIINQWGTGEEIPKLFFKPSGIAISPIDGKIYIINYIGRILIILNPNGELYTVLPLSIQLFSQPEGICFDAQGNLFISNEGGEEYGYILKFDLKK